MARHSQRPESTAPLPGADSPVGAAPAVAQEEQPAERAFRRNRLAVVLVALIALGIGIAVLGYRLGSTGASAEPTPGVAPSPSPSATPPSVSEVFSQVGPSVVVVRTPKGLGTGVIVAEDGTILTALHVVAGAPEITVTYFDGTATAASVASSDPGRDIAALAPESLPQPLVPAVLGGGTEPGTPVVAIGNPLGLPYSVSSGIVAGLNRTAETDSGEVSGLIQFDASVNPGSSGGPLLDQNGAVIGIVVSIADPSGDDSWAGVGFAVPIGAALAGDEEGPGPGGGPRL